MIILEPTPKRMIATDFNNKTYVVENVISIDLSEKQSGHIIPYSQRSPLWKDDPIITKSIGQTGCAMTCCAMLASQFDSSITPKSLNEYLKSTNSYTRDNRIYWSRVSGLVPQLQFENYHLWRNEPANIDLFTKEINKHPVIIQVDFYPGGELNTHFVLALSKTHNDINIIDPWDGAYTQLMQRYALENWDLARALYAMVVYEW